MRHATNVETADVFRDDEKVGRLARTAHGAIFQYDLEFLQGREGSELGIAFHLPFRKQPFEIHGVNLHPFFAGLLPEGLRLQSVLQRIKTSPDDLFSILVSVGADCVGDVWIVPEGEQREVIQPIIDLSKTGELDFYELYQRSIDPASDIWDASIPGVQEKISGRLISFPIRSRIPNAAFILKLNPPDRPNLVANEQVVLRIASDCGLVINRAEVIRDALGNEGLLVTRFDRIRVRSSSRVRRIHQEDGCQILDRYPADKYRIRAQDIAEGIIEYASAPVIQILRFIEMYVFSYLIGNADMHAKNVSLYQSPPTNLIELTPAYDLVCTLIYKGIDPSMAMRLDGRDDSFHRKDFVRFGERYGLREKVTNAAINNLCDRFRPWLDRIDQLPVEGKRLDHISSVLRRRFADLIG